MTDTEKPSDHGGYVVFRRDDFYELMGELALPPGSGAPSDMDCAPLAQRILDRVGSVEISADVAVHVHVGDRPLLGMATTRELLAEITARIDVDGHNGGGGLDYRTVGP